MRVLVACECSGIVREAFKAKGHDAWSCDLQDTEILGQHIKGDVLNILNDRWDMMIAHPVCTRLANSGVKHLYIGCDEDNGIDPVKWREMEEGAEFFNKLKDAPIEKKAIENPVMHTHSIKLTGGGSDSICSAMVVWKQEKQGHRVTAFQSSEARKNGCSRPYA